MSYTPLLSRAGSGKSKMLCFEAPKVSQKALSWPQFWIMYSVIGLGISLWFWIQWIFRKPCGWDGASCTGEPSVVNVKRNDYVIVSPDWHSNMSHVLFCSVVIVMRRWTGGCGYSAETECQCQSSTAHSSYLSPYSLKVTIFIASKGETSTEVSGRFSVLNPDSSRGFMVQFSQHRS